MTDAPDTARRLRLYAWRKEIWLPMIVHAAYDLAAIMIIYMNWEEAVARCVF